MSRRRHTGSFAAAAVALSIAVGLGLGVPPGASAHAKLVRTVPVAGAVLQQQPPRVAFYFNEPVEASFGVIRVYGPDGVEVQAGAPARPPGESNALEVALQPNLPRGTYSAAYRIISADSYPVSGGVVFSIGARSAGASTPRAGPTTGTATEALFWADRWLGYGAIGLAVGALFFLAFAWRPAVSERDRRSEGWLQASAAFDRGLRRLIGVAVAVGILVSLLALPLQGASAAGTSLWGALNAGVIDTVVHTRFGSLMLVRAGAWALLGGILLIAARRSRRAGAALEPATATTSIELIALVMLPIASLLVSPALAGHARTQSPAAVLFPTDIVHVTAMSLWLGGLATLAFAVAPAARLLAPPQRHRVVHATVSQFSVVALAAAAALAVSGVVQAAFEVGHVSALVETAWGRSVLAKSLLLGGLIGLGAANRKRLIPGLGRAAAAVTDRGRIWAALRRNVRIEVALIAAVLGVTALLVAYSPPNATSSVVAPEPQGRVSGRTTIGGVTLRYTIDPARVGLNTLNLYLRQDGRPYTRTRTIRVELRAPEEETEPRLLTLEQLGPGHYVNTATELDRAGRWSVTVRTTGTSSAFDDEAEIQVAIG